MLSGVEQFDPVQGLAQRDHRADDLVQGQPGDQVDGPWEQVGMGEHREDGGFFGVQVVEVDRQFEAGRIDGEVR